MTLARPALRAAGVALWTCVLTLAFAARAAADEAGAELTVSVLTIGPGTHPFFKFGHNAILVRDVLRGRDEVYNYGTFDFGSPTLVRDFLKGRLLYWLSVQPLEATVAHYAAENRSILAQELALTPAERLTLVDRLRSNALPENRYYRYDYYADNCSTRIRDGLDRLLGGRLRATSTASASLSLRGHTERLTADDVGVYLAIDAAMGDVVDRPISQWEEMFLPSKLAEALRRTTVARPAGEAPLVARETLLLAADRPPLRASPPRWGLRMGLAGLGAGAVLAALGMAGGRRRLARVAFGALLGGTSLAAGLLGSVLVFLWVATDHVVAHHNANVLQCSPVGLVAAGVCLGVARAGDRATRAGRALTLAMAGSSALGLLVKALPGSSQDNGPIVALCLPLWVGAAVGAWALHASRSTGDARAQPVAERRR